MRRALLVLAVLAACADGPPIPAGDLLLRVEPGVEEVELGRAFPLTVVRVWRSDLEPEGWDAAQLAPLTVELEETQRRESGGRVEETLRYRAYAFDLERVSVPRLRFAAQPRAGGDAREAVADGFAVQVVTALDPQAPGPPELPGEPPARRFPWLPVSSVAVAALVAGALLARRRGRGGAPEPATTSRESPRDEALERLGRLRATPPGDVGPFHEQVAGTLRDYVAAAYAAGGAQCTSEEIVLALPAPAGEAVGAALADCDAVKFACAVPGPAACERLLDDVERFVREGPR